MELCSVTRSFTEDTCYLHCETGENQLTAAGTTVLLDPSSCLFFAKAPSDVSSEQLLNLFSHFGTVKDINLFRRWPTAKASKGCGTVQFTDHLTAAAALEALNGKFKFPGSSHPLVVEWLDLRRHNKPVQGCASKAFNRNWIVQGHMVYCIQQDGCMTHSYGTPRYAPCGSSWSDTPTSYRQPSYSATGGNKKNTDSEKDSMGSAVRTRRSSCPEASTSGTSGMTCRVISAPALLCRTSSSSHTLSSPMSLLPQGQPTPAAASRSTFSTGRSAGKGECTGAIQFSTPFEITGHVNAASTYVDKQHNVVYGGNSAVACQAVAIPSNRLPAAGPNPASAGSVWGYPGSLPINCSATCHMLEGVDSAGHPPPGGQPSLGGIMYHQFRVQQPLQDSLFAAATTDACAGLVAAFDNPISSSSTPMQPVQCTYVAAVNAGLDRGFDVWQMQETRELLLRITPEMLTAIGSKLAYVTSTTGAKIQVQPSAGGYVLTIAGNYTGRALARKLLCDIIEQQVLTDQYCAHQVRMPDVTQPGMLVPAGI